MPAFQAALRNAFTDICSATGVAIFELAEIEIRLAAHSGGDLPIHPFDRSAPAMVEPRDNRLVAFPSFMLHEVLPVSVSSRSFADSRFSVSCGFGRERPEA